MYVTNLSDDYDNITSNNFKDCDKISFANCTNTEYDNVIILSALLLTIPCDLSFFF